MSLWVLSFLLAAASPLSAAVLRLVAYDEQGRVMGAEALKAYTGRADRRKGLEPDSAAIVVFALDGGGFEKPVLKDENGRLLLRWTGPERARLGLSWPVRGDGFSAIRIDKGGEGYRDGETVFLNEEIARAQFGLLQKAWLRRTKDWNPLYQPGSKSRKLYEKAALALEDAAKISGEDKRAEAFDEALHETSMSWQKLLFEHGLQIAHNEKTRGELRYGLTLDESFANHVESQKWVIERVARSRANWVRLVFKANPADFTYEYSRSFAVYDQIVTELRARNIRIMASVLDSTQWPRGLTPEAYSRRTRNLLMRYATKIRSWEVGSELNGDWHGGLRTPLGLDKVFRIYQEGVKTVKSHEPTLETVATLYWWDTTAPGEEYSLSGWLRRFIPEGFGKDIDVVSLSLQPEDHPVGTAFERIFDEVHQALPNQKLMLGSFGYVEKTDVIGYWWFDPKDTDAARKDLLVLYTAAACAAPRSLCGGFWWQTLDQMLQPQTRKVTDLFWVYQKSLEQMGR